jgi:hypothetical protein
MVDESATPAYQLWASDFPPVAMWRFVYIPSTIDVPGRRIVGWRVS